MSQLINSFPIGTIFYQSGKGYPTHIATRGCTYIDVDTGTMYINKDGIVDWEEIIDNPVDYIYFNTGQTATYNGGDLFWVDSENALSYKPYTLNNDVTINLGQETLIRVFNQTGSQINNGKVVIITGATSSVGAIALAIGSDGDNTLFKVSGVATHDIPNNSYGFITQFGNVNDIDLSNFQLGETVYLSQTIAGDLVSYSDLYFTGRTTEIGEVLNNSSNGRLKVSIINENPFSNITQLESNILNANTSSTGLFDFSGITIQSPTTFNVGQAKGWVVDNISNPIKPTITYVEFNGLSGQTTPYLNTNPITYILLTTGSTLTLQPTPPTPKQRRQNLYLGKLGHANLTTIIQAFNEPDIEESPLSQVRDMFQPIRLINNGVYPSPNGTNLSFNTSSGLLYGFGINFVIDNFTPNTLSVSGQSPTTFQYRTQTGGTGTNITVIDPTSYDNGGVITTVGGGTNRSTNQRIFLTQNGTIRLQYGQEIYSDLPTAIAASQTETFNTFSNFRDNAILIGVLSVRHTATDLSDSNYAKFLLASKFGETVGAAGGVSTTNLQQAYNNSTNPEIITNNILGAVQFQGGTGSDLDANIIIEDNAGNQTGSWLADGTLYSNTISATTYENLPSYNLSGLTDVSITGTPTNGQILIYDAGIWKNSNSDSSAQDMYPFSVKNNYVTMSLVSTYAGTGTFRASVVNTNRTVVFENFTLRKGTTIDEICLMHNAANTGTGSTLTLYIYDNSNGGLPGTKLFQQISSTGIYTVAQKVITFTPNLTLPAGNYWIGFHNRNLDTASANPTFVGGITTRHSVVIPPLTYSTTGQVIFLVQFQDADLGNNPILTTGSGTQNTLPQIWFKVS